MLPLLNCFIFFSASNIPVLRWQCPNFLRTNRRAMITDNGLCVRRRLTWLFHSLCVAAPLAVGRGKSIAMSPLPFDFFFRPHFFVLRSLVSLVGGQTSLQVVRLSIIEIFLLWAHSGVLSSTAGRFNWMAVSSLSMSSTSFSFRYVVRKVNLCLLASNKMRGIETRAETSTVAVASTTSYGLVRHLLRGWGHRFCRI